MNNHSNVHLSGFIYANSTMSSVLNLLRKTPRRTFSQAEIRLATGRSSAAVNWTLFRLRSEDTIRQVGDPGNPNSLRYQVATGSQNTGGRGAKRSTSSSTLVEAPLLAPETGALPQDSETVSSGLNEASRSPESTFVEG